MFKIMIFLQFFFPNYLQSFSNFINSDECIRKIKKKLSEYTQFLLKKDLSIKNRFFKVKKL